MNYRLLCFVMVATTSYGMEGSDNLEGLNPVYRVVAKYAFGNKLFTNFLAFAVSHGVFQAVSHKVSMAFLNTWDYTWNKTIGEMWARFQLKRDIKSAIKSWEEDVEPVKDIPILSEELKDYRESFLNPHSVKTDRGLITPSHLLLYGKPGAGKTTFLNHLAYLAAKNKKATMLFRFPRAIFDTIPTPLIGIALENYVAGCAEMVKANGKEAGCIIIEELDLLIGTSRDPQKSTERQRSAFTAFLNLMEKLKATKTPMSIGATTNIDTIDEALEDRFHYKVPMHKPSFGEGIEVFAQTISEGQNGITLMVNWEKIADKYESEQLINKYAKKEIKTSFRRADKSSFDVISFEKMQQYSEPLYLDHKFGYRRWKMIADNVLTRSKTRLLKTKGKQFDCTDLVEKEIDSEIQRQLKRERDGNYLSPLIVNQSRSLTVVNPTLVSPIGSTAVALRNNNKMEEVE